MLNPALCIYRQFRYTLKLTCGSLRTTSFEASASNPGYTQCILGYTRQSVPTDA
jgi:hypothetical protein